MFLRIQKWDSEEKLIRACQRKEAAAQRELYNRYARRLLGVCMRYFNDSMEAEDVMSNGFVKIFDKIEQYQFSGSFEGWLRRIMVNEALQQVRRNKTMYLETNIDTVYNDTAVMLVNDNELEAEDLLRMVQQLPDGYRTVFNLYAIEGYSHKEISELLDISESTSKSQLSRARALLQTYVQNSEKKMLVASEQIG